MRRYAFYLAFALLAFGLDLSVYGQNAKQRSFFIESQPDSPLLIRDLSAKILPVNKYRTSPEIEVIFYVENVGDRKVKRYSFQDPEEDSAKYEDYNERGFGGSLVPRESYRWKLNMSVEGKSLIYRIKEVEFEDGTKWKAKAFNSSKAKKSARITVDNRKVNDSQTEKTKAKRIITREWTEFPVFADRVSKVLDGAPKIIEGIKIQTKIHELKVERLDLIESCDIHHDNLEVIHNDRDYEVEKFTSYQVKGKVFAYEVHYEFIEAENDYYIGAGTIEFYVDEEGNGKFKLLCNDSGTELKSLPEWVKTLAAK